MSDLAMQDREHPKAQADCAWCACIFDDLVALLAHVESCHLDAPDPEFDAAA